MAAGALAARLATLRLAGRTALAQDNGIDGPASQGHAVSRQPGHRGPADRPGAARTAGRPPTQPISATRSSAAASTTAYGAFQRGYYLTALELALPRAEQGDRAAQTLIGEIYAKGLGVAQDDQKAAATGTRSRAKQRRSARHLRARPDVPGRPRRAKDRKRAAELFQQRRRRRQHDGQVQSRPALHRGHLRRRRTWSRPPS